MKLKLLFSLVSIVFLSQEAMARWSQSTGCFGTPNKNDRSKIVNNATSVMYMDYVTCPAEESDLINMTRSLVQDFQRAKQSPNLSLSPEHIQFARKTLLLWDKHLKSGVKGKDRELRRGARKNLKFRGDQNLRSRKRVERKLRVEGIKKGKSNYLLERMRESTSSLQKFAQLSNWDSMSIGDRNELKNYLEKRYRDIRKNKHFLRLPRSNSFYVLNGQLFSSSGSANLGGEVFDRQKMEETLKNIDNITEKNYCEIISEVVKVEAIYWEQNFNTYFSDLAKAEPAKQLATLVNEGLENSNDPTGLNYEYFGHYVQRILSLWEIGSSTGEPDADSMSELSSHEMAIRLRGEFDHAFGAVENGNSRKCGVVTNYVDPNASQELLKDSTMYPYLLRVTPSQNGNVTN